MENIIDLRNFSRVSKLLRVTAFVLRFVENLKTKVKGGADLNFDDGLAGEQIDTAVNYWIRSVQTDL